MGTQFRWYRLLYATLSSLGLLTILAYGLMLPRHAFWDTPREIQWIGMVIATYGIIIIRRTFKYYSLTDFLGLSHMSDDQPLVLETGGIFSYIRHPLYAGGMLILVGYFLFTPGFSSIITFTTTFLYVLVAIPLEEKKLRARFGEAYEAYQKEVPALFPKLRRM